MNGMLSIARSRFTAKQYDPAKPLTDAELADLLEILRLAPSSVNIQPWHFYVVRSEKARARLLPTIKDFNLPRVKNAGAVILFAIEKDLMARAAAVTAQECADGRFDAAALAQGFDKTMLAFRQGAVQDYSSGIDQGEIWAREQANIALGFILFAAAGMGIDATSLGGIFFDRADEIFGLAAAGRKSIVGLALGHRAADDENAPRPKSRLAKDQVVTML